MFWKILIVVDTLGVLLIGGLIVVACYQIKQKQKTIVQVDKIRKHY